MAEPIRVGIVSTSWWADLMYLPSLQNHPHAEIVAICGRNRVRADEMARKYRIPHVFTDYRTLLAEGNLQALIVATPDDLHYPITMQALEAGLHVLCEKPLALNGGQARAMWEKAEAMGVKHMVLFTWRWLPHLQYLHHLLAQGYIGRCLHCQFTFLSGYARSHRYEWQFDPQRGTGVLGNLGAHIIDLAHWYVGDIANVSARLHAYYPRVDSNGQPFAQTNDAAVLAVEFANGAQGSLQASAVAHLGAGTTALHVALHGEDGMLEVDVLYDGVTPREPRLRGVRHDEKGLQLLPIPETFYGEITRADFAAGQSLKLFSKQPVGSRQFIDAIVADQLVSPNFYDGFKAQAVIDAAIESHRIGSRVSVR